jgi:hypothetical protein
MNKPFIRTFKWNIDFIRNLFNTLEKQYKKDNTNEQLISRLLIYDALFNKLLGYRELLLYPEKGNKIKKQLGISSEKQLEKDTNDVEKSKTIDLKDAIEKAKATLFLFQLQFPEAKQYITYIQMVANAVRDQVTHTEHLTYPTYPLPTHELYRLVNEFFSDLDPNIYKLFDRMFNNEQLLKQGIDFIDIREKDCGFGDYFTSGCYYDCGDSKPNDTRPSHPITYVSLIRKNTIQDIYTLVHEIMHAICHRVNDNSPITQNLTQIVTNEIGPIFVQFVMDDYLIEKSEVSPEEIAILRMEKLQQIELRARLISNGIELPQLNEDSIITDLHPIISGQTLDTDIAYMLSFLIAHDLYLQYEKDRTKALSNLKTIMLNKDKDLMELLETIGIDYTSYYTVDNYKAHVEEVQHQLYAKVLRKQKEHN